MIKEHVTDLTLLGLISAHVLAAIAGGYMLAKLVGVRDARGWQRIRPGGSHWFAAFGSWAFAILISWVWLFVGSARCDAADQMRWAYLLAMVFALAAAYMFAYNAALFRTHLQWNAKKIGWHAKGADHIRDVREVIDLQPLWSGAIKAHFPDGLTLSIDPNATGAQDLLIALSGSVMENLFETDDDPLK